MCTFAEITDTKDVVVRRRHLRRQLFAMRVIVAVLLVAAVCVAGYPYAMQWRTDRTLQAQDKSIAEEISGWPYPKAAKSLKAARAYNSRLAQNGQPVLGEAVDPFSSTAGASTVDNASKADSEASKDQEYQGLLNARGSVMGAIRIPKISVDLPIFHGTSQEALDSGVGHLYGTSLPVGGMSTHSVITGHRGLTKALMFTRLDEMNSGDLFFIDVMGETLAYQVDRINVIEPNDTDSLKIVPGQDRVTLMTCTPYGVNTHRLLVSGHRVPLPEAPQEHDARVIAALTGLGALAAGWLAIMLKRRMQRGPRGIMRHMSWRPR